MKKAVSFILTLILLTSSIFSIELNVFAANQIGKVNCTALNVRSGAGTSYSKITTLNNGAEVTITGSANDSAGDKWYKISFNSSGTTKTGYAYGEYITVLSSDTSSPTTDSNFEKYLTSQGFPDSYKPMLRDLHKKYPKWVFKAQNLNIDWNTALTQECVVGRNLVHSGALASWKSMEKGAYNFDKGYWYGLDGGWVAASKEIIAYYLDPRNFINDPSIFMFENLSYNSSVHTIDGVKNILAKSFMKGNFVAPDTKKTYSYAQTFIDAAKKSGVSPYHLASRCLNEQGINGAPQSLGTVPGYKNYFNFFDINAYATSNMTAQQMGCKYAMTTNPTYLLPWTNQYKSIVGGSIFLGGGYINKEQDTLYLQKFDMVDGGNGYYYHQYMTCVFGQENEAAFMKKAYSQTMLNSAMEFKIPVYKNMPNTLYKKPTSSGDNNNFLKSLSVSGKKLNKTFDKYTMSYSLTADVKDSEVTVNATKLSDDAKITGTGKVSLKIGSNKVNVKVTAPSGVARTYTITINRVADKNYVPNVTGFKASPKSTSVKLSWEKVSDANGYIVYKYDNSKKKWVELKKLDSKTLSYTVSKLSSATKYKFAVKAYKTVDKKTISSESYSQAEIITLMSNVTGFKVSPKSTSVKLSWEKVSDANGYIVYKYDNSKKKWVELKKLDTKTLSYTASKLSSATKYKFAVKAYKTVDKKTISSESYSQAEIITLMPNVTGFKVSTKSTSATLSWKKVSNASGYIVYKYDNSKKKWVELKKLSSKTLSHTVSKLSSATKYKFAVKAYKTVDKKTISSESYSQAEVLTKLANAKNLKANADYTKVKLTWQKVSKAGGYYVYKYNPTKKTWNKIGKTKSSVTSYTASKLYSGTKFQFAVKAYKIVDKKEVLSESYSKFTVSTKKSKIKIIG